MDQKPLYPTPVYDFGKKQEEKRLVKTRRSSLFL